MAGSINFFVISSLQRSKLQGRLESIHRMIISGGYDLPRLFGEGKNSLRRFKKGWKREGKRESLTLVVHQALSLRYTYRYNGKDDEEKRREKERKTERERNESKES